MSLMLPRCDVSIHNISNQFISCYDFNISCHQVSHMEVSLFEETCFAEMDDVTSPNGHNMPFSIGCKSNVSLNIKKYL